MSELRLSQPRYTTTNLLSFLLHTATTISLLVFLTSTQSFLLTTQLHVPSKTLGSITGTLTSLDEITNMCASPFIGSMVDWYGIRRRGVSRIVAVFGLLVISVVLYAYTFASTVWPTLALLRVFFSLGVSCAVGMFGVMLAECVGSGFQLTELNPFAKKNNAQGEGNRLLEQGIEQDGSKVKKAKGTFSALLGISSGLGAVFAVLNYLPLADRFSSKYGDSPGQAIIHSYETVSIIALFTAIVLCFGLYQRPAASTTLIVPHRRPAYLSLLKSGFQSGLTSPSITLSYIGSFLARTTSILSSVFIPLYVHTHFIHNGQCNYDPERPILKESCHDAYVQAMILTGIVNTMGLISAPFVGYIINRFGGKVALNWSFILGLVSCLGFGLSSKALSVVTIISSTTLGLSQIGFIITSMALLTSKPNRHNIGAVNGVYSFVGGIGILVLSNLGGWVVDWSAIGGAVFWVMAVIETIGLALCWSVVEYENEDEN